MFHVDLLKWHDFYKGNLELQCLPWRTFKMNKRGKGVKTHIKMEKEQNG